MATKMQDFVGSKLTNPSFAQMAEEVYLQVRHHHPHRHLRHRAAETGTESMADVTAFIQQANAIAEHYEMVMRNQGKKVSDNR